MSAAGVHENLGITVAYNYEYAIKWAFLESAEERIFLADSSKFDRINRCFFADIDNFHTVITDTNLPERWIDIIRGQGIELVMV
jgi:DeoR family deoxyribose operon repressor